MMFVRTLKTMAGIAVLGGGLFALQWLQGQEAAPPAEAPPPLPKGVEVSHRAVVRLVRETGFAAFGPGEVFLQLAPMSFDLATFELWGPLLHGGRLALLPPAPRLAIG